jgi:hypothetical protein
MYNVLQKKTLLVGHSGTKEHAWANEVLAQEQGLDIQLAHDGQCVELHL